MEHYDFVKRQIDLIGVVLGKILSGMLNLKATGNTALSITTIAQDLKSELGLDLNSILNEADDKTIGNLIGRNFSMNDLTMLADIFSQLADSYGTGTPQGLALYRKSLLIYEYTLDQILSFDAYLKSEHIRTILQQVR